MAIFVAVSAGIMTWLRYWRWLFFTTGLIWAVIFAMSRLADRLPESLEGIDIPITGVIVGLPEQDERRTRFDFMVIKSAQKIPLKIRLTWYFPEQVIKAGQRWSFVVKLKRPHGSMNPGGFDYERWLFSQNVGAQPVMCAPIQNQKCWGDCRLGSVLECGDKIFPINYRLFWMLDRVLV
jgi:Predicted membrane metal-binding protein